MKEENLLEDLKKGWSFFGKGKFHYFNNKPITLCEKYKFKEIPVLINCVGIGDCCKVCLDKLKKEMI